MIEKPLAGVDYPARIAELRSWFPSDEACADYLDWLRWPYGFVCPRCGRVKAWEVAGRRRCAGCRRWVSVTAGTIFHGTRVPLTVWFEAAWLMCAPKNGVSAQTLANLLPIGSYQTAWTMLGKYRSAIDSSGKDKLSGVVEVDEWFHGGVAKGGDSMTGKHLVAAALEHAPNGHGYGRLRLGVVENRSAFALRRFIHDNIEPGSRIITDGLSTYKATMAGYVHEARNESAPGADPAHELLPGVHRVFSLAERWLLGTHQGGVQAGHLQEYLDEFVFRWNRRHAANRGLLFMRLLEHAVTADPMPYNALVRTGIGGDEELPVPIIHSKPGTLEISPTGRPWRTSHAIAA
jgi:predicted RNA-binding Zn-ribbon protein involved in translation (DUF1610 family)